MDQWPGTCTEASTLPWWNDVFDVCTVAANAVSRCGCGLRAQSENDLVAIIAQTDERHEFPSC